MDIFWSLQAFIDNSSLTDPPGWTIVEIPTLDAISTQSGKGKKASEAIEAPLTSNLNCLAFSIAANALSSQSMYVQSNFYLNLAKYLNKDFLSVQKIRELIKNHVDNSFDF